MRFRAPAFIVAALAMALGSAGHAIAQEVRYDVAQPAHQLLERLAGEWDFERRGPATDSGTPQTLGRGRVSAEMIGDFFVASRWSGTIYGFDYEALQTLGYDVESERYRGDWMDSFMSFRWELSGSVDDANQELVLTSAGPAPTGGTATFRERYRFEDADVITVFGEMQQGDGWAALSTTVLTRRR